MTMRTTRPVHRRAGLTLIEVMLVVTILAVLTRSLLESTSSMSELTEGSNIQALLAQQAQEASAALLEDLRYAGIRTVNGARYPSIYEDGDADDALFSDHDHVPGVQEAGPGDLDFGVPHAMILVLPTDLDRDARPDFDGDLNGTPELDGDQDGLRSESGADTALWDPAANTIDGFNGLVWGHQEISWLVVTGADGVNWLERRVDADASRARRVARDVELMTIETAADTGFEIPTNALRVRLFFRRRDSAGILYRHRTELVVRLLNGDLEF